MRRLCMLLLLIWLLVVMVGCASKPRLILPPVPDKADLHIEGDHITADNGGELVLRGYVRCRQINSEK